jgi:hypothetical protein
MTAAEKFSKIAYFRISKCAEAFSFALQHLKNRYAVIVLPNGIRRSTSRLKVNSWKRLTESLKDGVHSFLIRLIAPITKAVED